MAQQTRIVGTTVVVDAASVVTDAEIAFDASTGRVNYLGPARPTTGPGVADIVDGRDRIVAPGLVNTHGHAAMSLLRGASDDADFPGWLAAVRGLEVGMTHADIRAGLALAMVEMIRSGTVGFCDMYLWDETLLGDVVTAGLRVNAATAIFGPDAVGYPAATTETGADVLDRTAALAAAFRGEETVRVSYGPHAFYTAGDELIADVARRSSREGLDVHVHLSETRAEVDASLADTGQSPIGRAAGAGLTDGRLLVAHAVHPVGDDVDLLTRPGVTVAHNPVSNLKLGAGIAPLADYLAAGVRVGLGTDSAASNNSLDLFEELKLAALLPRGIARDPAAVSGATCWRMATTGGAAALHPALTGRLAVGEPADLMMVRTDRAAGVPLGDPVALLTFATTGAAVTDLFVAGRGLLRSGRLTTLDEAGIRADAARRVARLRTTGHPDRCDRRS